VKQLRGLAAFTAATITLVASHQPAAAAPAQVSNVRLNPTRSGVDVVLETAGGDRAPQVFNVNRGNTWTAYVFNTNIPQPFQQNNPAPGISSVSVSAIAGNGVQVVVVGEAAAPSGQVSSRNAQGGGTPVAQASSMTTPAPSATPQQPVAQAPSSTPIAPLVPNPALTSQGTPNLPSAPTPPLFNRAVAPPVGDISVSQLDTAPTTIDLGTNERIPRLVLRDAPVREVLSLLAKAAGLNLAYSEPPKAGGASAAPGQTGSSNSGGPTISLDIENESVNDVFNYVLRVACVPASGAGAGSGSGQCESLQASRSGRTIFVGSKLPNAARGIIVRSIRLNQVNSSSAVKFLIGLGAESASNPEKKVATTTSTSRIDQGGQTTQPQEAASTESMSAQRIDFQDGVPLLRGLQVLGDERTNSVTLVGVPKHVELAVSQLVLLDSRRRMVAVNVKVIDVNLLAIRRAGTSFSFGIGKTQFINTGGTALLNFGNQTPSTNLGASAITSAFGSVVGSSPSSIRNGLDLDGFAKDFSIQLQAAVTNGNAKVLTDPTLLVQEGQTANVSLIQEVITNFSQQTTFGTGTSQTTVTVEKKPAGLILPVKVDRIDDNGFISLSVAPSITRPDQTQSVQVGNNTFQVTLLSERRLESGQVRVRDGQTLILSGIIQEADRVNATKVPVLGDLPLLGSLFRRTERENERREVIVLLTPQIVDDSDKSNFGYGYVPGPEVRQMMQQNR
jgi:type IV pilus assembly protein PilQ